MVEIDERDAGRVLHDRVGILEQEVADLGEGRVVQKIRRAFGEAVARGERLAKLQERDGLALVGEIGAEVVQRFGRAALPGKKDFYATGGARRARLVALLQHALLVEMHEAHLVDGLARAREKHVEQR